MLRFSVNLSLIFTELALIDRISAVKSQGFDAIEIQFPYAIPAIEIRTALRAKNVELILFNIDADDLLSGGEGLAAAPSKRNQYYQAVEVALDYAKILKPQVINVLPGRCFDDSLKQSYLDTFVENLQYTADKFESLGIRTVFEAANLIDMPGFLIHNHDQLIDILERTRHPNLFIQYDIYHMTRMEQNIIPFIDQHIDKIGHIQFADCPGRHEPGTGEIDFKTIFKIVNDSAYSGHLGAEYNPSGHSKDSFDWYTQHQICGE